MKTKPSRRLSLLPLVLVASLAAGCTSADADAGSANQGAPDTPDQAAPGDGAPGQGAPGGPGGAPAKAEPTFAWARALDWQVDSLKTATAPNGEMIVVGVTKGDAPVVVDALSLDPPAPKTMFVARFAADGTPLYLRELAHLANGNGAPPSLFVSDVAVDAQGGFAVTGSTFNSPMALPDGATIADLTGYLLRVAADGSLVWHDQPPGDGGEALAIDAQGAVAFVGSASRAADGDILSYAEMSLRVYGPDGTVKWERSIDEVSTDATSPVDVQFTPDGAVHWSGLMKAGYLPMFDGPTAPPKFLNTDGSVTLFSAKYGPDGTPFFEDSYAARSSGEFFSVRSAVDEAGEVYVQLSLDSATIELPGLSGADGVAFDGGVIKFDAQGVPQGLLPFAWGENTFVSGFERAPGGRLVLSGVTDQPIIYLAADGAENVELLSELGGREDGFLLTLDAATGQAQSDRAYGDAFNQNFRSFSANASGAFSLQGEAEGSMQLGAVSVGDQATPGSRVFLAAGSL